MKNLRPAVGDTVKLGPTAREKHHVMHAPKGSDYVTVRQWTTGKIRDVRVDRCVVVSTATTGT